MVPLTVLLLVLLGCSTEEPADVFRRCVDARDASLEQVRACDRLLTYYDEGSRGYGAVLTWRARAKERVRDIAGAKRDYEASLAINPDGGFALLGLGGILLDEGDLPGAEIYLHRSIEVHGSGRAADMLGGYALQHGQNQVAFDYYNDLLTRVPDHASGLYGRGVARLRIGDAGGQADIEKARAEYPNIDHDFAERGIGAQP